MIWLKHIHDDMNGLDYTLLGNHLHWVGMMNAIKSQVEEIIWNEIIYK